MKKNQSETPLSAPADLAIAFANQQSVCAASFDSDGQIQTRVFEISRLHESLRSWRQSIGQDLTLETNLRLGELFFTAYTRIASVGDETLESLQDDGKLIEWLLDAAESNKMGENGFPLFESSTKQTAYDFARLPNGKITLTELRRDILDATIKQAIAANIYNEREVSELTAKVPDDAQPVFIHHVETRNRAAARFFLHQNYQTAKPDDGELLFLTITADGASFGVWNLEESFYYELGEIFRIEVDEQEIPAEMSRLEYEENLFRDEVERFLQTQISPFLFPERSEHVKVLQIYAAIGETVKSAAGVVKDFADQLEIPYVPSAESLEEIVAQGLLLAFDAQAVADVPSINLAFDITQQQEATDEAVRNKNAVAALARQRATVFALIAPTLAAVAVLFGLYVDTWRANTALSLRESRAVSEIARLKPKLDTRAKYEKTLAWYQDILRQEIGLRQKQGAALAFPSALDTLYPKDPGFYVSDLNIKPGGAFEIKGLARREDDVRQFIAVLDDYQPEQPNAPAAINTGDGQIFQGLQFEFKQGSKLTGAGGGGGTLAPASSTLSGNLAPDVSAFIIRGTFAPMGALKVSSATPVAPAAPVNAPAPNAPGPNGTPNAGAPAPAPNGTPNAGAPAPPPAGDPKAAK